MAWNRFHILQLATGYDWFGHAFGRLHELPEQQIREAADAMLVCWQEREAEVRERARSPWFEQYAFDLEALVQRYLADPLHQRRVAWRKERLQCRD
jgi:hypothetical protein